MDKYRSFMLVMFFLCLLMIGQVNASVRNYSMLGKCVYLDAGHGGADSGAVSDAFLEKDMNLLLVNKLAVEFTSRGVMVFLTRDGDYDLANSTINRKRDDLYNRVLLINKSKCDLYVSVHMNSSPSGKWNGIQVFYSNILEDNRKVAEVVTDSLRSNMANVRDYKKDNSYYMYSKIKIPGILVEAGFISNSNDNYKIRQDEYQDTLVRNIVVGVEKYFNN